MLKIPDIEKLKREFSTVAGINIDRIEVYMFPQTWPNTGCGFAEPGYCYGQAFTSEYTTVLIYRIYKKCADPDGYNRMIATVIACVCFGDKIAYTLDDPNDSFWGDLFSFNMAGIVDCDKYRKDPG